MGIALLIRHGRSTANVEGILAGRREGVGLAPEGRAQAQILAEALRDADFASVHVSPLQRTLETAGLALPGRAFIEADQIAECEYGAWSGKRIDDLSKDPSWAELHRAPSAFTFPDGETIAGIAERSVAYIREHAAAPGLHVFVTHADVILFVANHAVQAPLDSYQRMQVDPASLTVIGVHEERLHLFALNVPPDGARALVTEYSPRPRDSV